MESVNSQFLLSTMIIALGYVVKRFGIITEKDGDGLSRIVINVVLPAVVINAFSAIEVDLSLILLAVFSIVYSCLMAFLGLQVFKKDSRSVKGTLCMLIPGFNIGLFAYPLVEAILGVDGLKCFAMFDMGNAFIVFGVCFMLASYFSEQSQGISIKASVMKVTRSIPLITYVFTLALNLLNLNYPRPVLQLAGVVAKANMPMSLLLLGIYLSFSFDISSWKNMGKVLALRYGAGLAVGTALFLSIPYDIYFRYALLISPILPISLAVVPFSVQFGHDRKFVGTINSITIVLSFILMWIIFNIT